MEFSITKVVIVRKKLYKCVPILHFWKDIGV